MSFQKILDKYRKISFSERDKGDRFEHLMQAYLKTDPQYAARFKNVWLWNDFPGRKDLGGSDTGIDLVAKTHEGDYWAIQCKCYSSENTIDKPEVDSFLATSGRTFKNDDLLSTGFAHRLWISTTNKWGSKAREAIKNQNPQVSVIHLSSLMQAPVDWDKLENGIHGSEARSEKKQLYPHVIEVRDKVVEYLQDNERGKLIMACGTGKTMTSLKIAEKFTNGKGQILFLVPSIALIGQTLREWTSQSDEEINPICICSDPKITKDKKLNDDDLMSVTDLAWPASTDPKNILKQFEHYRDNDSKGMTVVFSTYQSIEVIGKAQEELIKNGFPEFDLIICDEAHRTTGVSLAGEDPSAFTRVHDRDFIKSRRRLYMTATPKLYTDDHKSKAAENDAVLCSMDDTNIYGQEIHHIGFGEAVERNLLTDYKVLILTLDDAAIPPAVQDMMTNGDFEVQGDDLSKLIGTVNAFSKQLLGDHSETVETDPDPMRRAVAFCPSIAGSKKISNTYNSASEAYIDNLPEEKRKEMVSVHSKHMDGSMSAPDRDEMLEWLKEEPSENECRVITNVKVLSEGVDVPSLDSVLFLSARNSQVDVVQSVGRVMRKAPGKKYGYIVIPIIVPSDIPAEEALNDNKRYAVVWTVLNALRAHDDRFNATVNKIDLNKRKPPQIIIGRPTVTYGSDGQPIAIQKGSDDYKKNENLAHQLAIQFEQLQSVIFARMVKKVGDRRYWEDWATEVAQIAERQIERITYLIENQKEQRNAFKNFLKGLQKNINPSISEGQAVEMLAQHIITKPIFEALFEGYSFTETNAVSIAMQTMLNALQEKTLVEESKKLQKFYDSVKRNISDLDNAEAKQQIIIRIYDNFFKTAFPKMVEQLGIVYTPVEVVDFIIHSVNDILKKEFGRSITDENIHILDPFTGTGTFITRLLQSGLIKKKDLERKYHQELHANEIVLLAYYIAAVNIENAFQDQIGKDKGYEAFEGIVLTDTFQLGETKDSQKLFSDMFPQNSKRVQRQKKSPVRVIIGNPPYSVGQRSTNDGAENQSYEHLDERIANTYGVESSSNNLNSLYDSYIKAFRWSTDRLDSEHGGIIAFVSNGSWLDGNSTDGFRKTIEKEFSSIWVFNLRGNQRTSGELSRKEGGKIFGSGSRTPISITFLVKNPDLKVDKATIHYHDIGDYLSREEKLATIKKFKSVGNSQMSLKTLQPNQHGDWLKQRKEIFKTFIPMAPEKKFDTKSQSYFTLNSLGIFTNRDAWSYNYSKSECLENMERLIDFYNSEVDRFQVLRSRNSNIISKEVIDKDPKKISWTSSLIPKLERGLKTQLDSTRIYSSLHRPYSKEFIYFGDYLIHRRGQFEQIHPVPYNMENYTIFLTGIGVSSEFSSLITNQITDGQFIQNCQCFPLYYYEEQQTNNQSLFDSTKEKEYVRRDAISNFILERAKKVYGKNVDKEDIFYYVYGILHSPDYRLTFANDLKKMLPRIPLVDDVRHFWKFSKAGRKLAELHINYETVPAYEGVKVAGEESNFFKVQKMRFPKKGQQDTIIYNSKIIVSNIPEKAYEYVVNGKSAIEWIMERYQVKTDSKSGIKNDPNDWAKEIGNQRYILDLLLSIINVSVQTVEIVENLPKLDFEDSVTNDNAN